MATLLFLIISIAFIGLGLPDSLFGSAWPAIYSELNLPISYANFVTTLISLGTVISSVFAARLVKKLGTGLVTFLSTLLTTFSLLIFSFGGNIIWFCLLAMPLGFGAGAIDASLNDYVSVHYSSTHMSFLHCFYGIGVSLSPLLMSFALSSSNDWRKGYLFVFLILLSIAIVTMLALPLWKKVKEKDVQQDDFIPKTLPLIELSKIPAVRTAWIVFFSSVALEFTCGIWGCTYLVRAENLSESLSARILTFYYLGITVGRFVSGLVAKKIYPEKIVYIGYGFVAVAIVLFFLPLPPLYKGLALFLVGFGNGPSFPNLTFITPINFGKEISGSIIGSQMACCNLGILVVPPIFGFLAQWLGVEIFPIFILILYAAMISSTIIYSKQTYILRKKRNSEKPLI